MTCGRCDQPIKPDQKHTTHLIHSNSGAGTTVHRHEDPCPPMPHPTPEVAVRR